MATAVYPDEIGVRERVGMEKSERSAAAHVTHSAFRGRRSLTAGVGRGSVLTDAACTELGFPSGLERCVLHPGLIGNIAFFLFLHFSHFSQNILTLLTLAFPFTDSWVWG